MKKKIIVFLLTLFPLILFAQTDVSRIGQVIYGPEVNHENQIFSSPIFMGFNLYRVHMALAYGGKLDSFSNYQYASLIVSLQGIVNYNVLDIMEFQTNKAEAIDSYLSNLDRYLMDSDIALSNIKEDMSSLQYTIQHCSSQKNIYDKQYIDAVKYPYQQAMLEESLANSKQYAKCISDAKIEYDAKKIIYNKLYSIRSVINTKYNYLSLNRNDIVDHYDIIKDDVLNRLTNIKNMLEKYDL